LLERSDELGGLHGLAADMAATGRGGVVIVSGEAGVGKTALLRQFRGELQIRSFRGPVARLPGQWSQHLSHNSGGCQPTFNLNPFEGSRLVFASSYLLPWTGRTTTLGPIRTAYAPSGTAPLFFNNARRYMNILKGGTPLDRAEELAIYTATQYTDGERYGVIAEGIITESSNRLEDLKATFPTLPDEVGAVSHTTPGTPAWSKALDSAFNSLNSANARATVSKAMRGSARALVAKLRKHRHGKHQRERGQATLLGSS
jgi:hypothetical protein